MGEKKEAGAAPKARAIAEKLREKYGDHPPKFEADVQAWHNKLYGRVLGEDESMDLFLAVCEVVEMWHDERN
jgi:hypothetical protein